MTYLRTSKRPGENRVKTIYTIVGFLVLIIIILQIIYPHFIPSVITSTFRPFWTAKFSASFGALETRESILLKNEDLNRKIAEYEIRLSTISEIERENSELKNILGRPENRVVTSSTTPVATTSDDFSDTTYYSFLRKNIDGRILSAVLVRPPFTGYDEYIIDIGSDFGVKVGDKVYAPGDVLIGKVEDVLANTSKVILFSSPGQKFEVTVGKMNDFATANGRGGGQYEVELPRDAVVADGDFVNSPSVDDKPLGVVSAVLSDPTQPFETVLFTSTVNIYNIRWVLVDVK